ncbi:MAG: DUF971 domain-containing protein [Pirellulaceae bacterium]
MSAEDASEIIPVSIERTGADGLVIEWSDGAKLSYQAAGLRKECPCATCKEKHGAKPEPASMGLPVLSLQEAQPLSIRSMRPVGNYAYNIAFSDGHDSGIFTFEHLHSLGS